MAGRLDEAGIYALDPLGKQVYLHAMYKNRGSKSPRLIVNYVGCGRIGRSQQVSERTDNPEHQEWLRGHWVPRTVLFAKPRRLERLEWLEAVLMEFRCPEGLVIFETPFLRNAERVEARLIGLYKLKGGARFNLQSGKLPPKMFRARPNQGCLREHVVAIRARAAAGESKSAIARDLGVDPASIRAICSGRSYAGVPGWPVQADA